MHTCTSNKKDLKSWYMFSTDDPLKHYHKWKKKKKKLVIKDHILYESLYMKCRVGQNPQKYLWLTRTRGIGRKYESTCEGDRVSLRVDENILKRILVILWID